MTERFFTRKEIATYSDPTGIQRGKGFNTLIQLSKAGRPLFLFGCGLTGRSWANAFSIPIQGFVDNDRDHWGKTICGLPVGGPVETARKHPDALFLISVFRRTSYLEIVRQCQELGVEYRPFCDYWTRDIPGPENPAEAEADDNLWNGYLLMADDLSRETYRCLARFWGTRDLEETPRFFPYHQYFSEIVPERYYRNFADVGAFDGDTLRMHIETMPRGFDNYYAIEPDPANLARFQPLPETMENLHLFPLAASDRPGVLGWDSAEGSSQSAAGGGEQVRCDRLDSILRDRPVSFIKMDLEGHEPLALQGARDIITTQRPALGICVYHRYEHIYQLPQWINSQAPGGYRFYLRHHLWGFMETVCYAVPT